ncbi:uncharacterized protein [Triticum aestivum]|nr:uncharacterized protein LOC123045715 isoform X3 [Triticum aestivum]XP_044324822.1 uncharacterized protein LOC123045715 isoform X3 [Triticum aestivum]
MTSHLPKSMTTSGRSNMTMRRPNKPERQRELKGKPPKQELQGRRGQALWICSNWMTLLMKKRRIRGTAKQLTKSVQVKPNKRAKKSKPSRDPVVTEPELGTTAPDSSTHQPPPEPACDIPAPTSDPHIEDTLNSFDNPEAPSPVKTVDPDIEILKTHFVEPGRPTVLAKCSAKEELLERRKAKLDIADYTHLSIGDIVSGYLNQVHSSRDLEIGMVKQIKQKSEATISQFESEMTDLKNRLAAQELEIQKANSKFEFSVCEQEKLKKNFEAEKKIWAHEKASLVTRAETAEALLAEATTELSGLKRQISQMVSTIFGPTSTNLKQNMLIKLKAVYTLVEELYSGSQRALAIVALSDDVPHLLQNVLKRLASLPQRIQDLRRASARAGAVAALSRAKVWIPELDPTDLALG